MVGDCGFGDLFWVEFVCGDFMSDFVGGFGDFGVFVVVDVIVDGDDVVVFGYFFCDC